jgi:SAM-dependent methyltransferase
MARIATHCPCCGGVDLVRSPAVLMPFIAFRTFGWTPVEITPEWGMKSLRTGMAYPLCNSVQCQACGLLFLDIRFSDEEMARLYADYRGEAYTQQRDRFEPGYAALGAAIDMHTPDTSDAERFLRPHVKAAPRVLDWGGDTGENTPFRATADAVDVYDLSDVPLIPGARRVTPDDIVPASYDLVVLSHVLEHVPEPETVVRPAAEALQIGGMLYVEAPYERVIAAAPKSRDLAALKRHWHEHINFYTEDSLRALLARCGLEVLEVEIRAFSSLVTNLNQVIAVVCRRG